MLSKYGLYHKLLNKIMEDNPPTPTNKDSPKIKILELGYDRQKKKTYVLLELYFKTFKSKYEMADGWVSKRYFDGLKLICKLNLNDLDHVLTPSTSKSIHSKRKRKLKRNNKRFRIVYLSNYPDIWYDCEFQTVDFNNNERGIIKIHDDEINDGCSRFHDDISLMFSFDTSFLCEFKVENNNIMSRITKKKSLLHNETIKHKTRQKVTDSEIEKIHNAIERICSYVGPSFTKIINCYNELEKYKAHETYTKIQLIMCAKAYDKKSLIAWLPLDVVKMICKYFWFIRTSYYKVICDISTLPRDIGIMLFSYLDSKSRALLGSTCRRFYDYYLKYLERNRKEVRDLIKIQCKRGNVEYLEKLVKMHNKTKIYRPYWRSTYTETQIQEGHFNEPWITNPPEKLPVGTYMSQEFIMALYNGHIPVIRYLVSLLPENVEITLHFTNGNSLDSILQVMNIPNIIPGNVLLPCLAMLTPSNKPDDETFEKINCIMNHPKCLENDRNLLRQLIPAIRNGNFKIPDNDNN